MDFEYTLITSGMLVYVAALVGAVFKQRLQLESFYFEWILQLIGIVMFTVTIILRWQLVGHGPFISMFEILLSSLFSLGLIFLIASLLFHDIRIASIPVYLVIILISYWSLVTTNDAGPLPPTYDNGWLWVHIFVGKVFLGLSLIAASLAITCLWLVTVMRKPTSSPDIRNLEATAWRYLSLSFIFHSLMLIAGAVWAQDAWGRYWGWDPLESWAFATWLSIALALHSRITYRLHAVSGWIMISAVFVLAFFTFFGVPFVSIAPHKGAI